MDNAGFGDIPADVLVEILLLLPPTSLRRLRLVCQHWRRVVDERTPSPTPTRAKIIAVSGPNAFHFHDLEAPRRKRKKALWSCGRGHMDMIGTSNGILCLGNGNGTSGIALVNPATRETLHVPPPPRARGGEPACCTGRSEEYSFAYDTTTERYTIVYFAVDEYDRAAGTFDVVRLFTLAQGASWRDVPAPARSSRRENCGVVSVCGYTYWVAADTDKLIELDLESERFAAVRPLPAPGDSCKLTVVRGRLGVAVTIDQPRKTMIEVWALEGGRGDWRWSRRCSVQLHGVHQVMACPQFVLGEHVLTTSTLEYSDRHIFLFAHKLSDEKSLECRSMLIDERRPVKAVVKADSRYLCSSNRIRTFAYVKTHESLSVYSPLGVHPDMHGHR